MGVEIHETAMVAKGAQLDDGVVVGPYSVIGPEVKIGKDTKVGSHVVIANATTIGEKNVIHPYASLGGVPQDKKYAGEKTSLVIGNGNTIREFTTFNIGTVTGTGITKMGDDNWIMAYVHVAHDCEVGSHTIFANNASLAGHVTVGDWVIMGGYSLVHQFCVIGDHAMTAFACGVHKDVPPFVMAAGYRAEPFGLNSEGMRRRGFTSEEIAQMKELYKILYRSGLSYDDAKREILEKVAEFEKSGAKHDFSKDARPNFVDTLENRRMIEGRYGLFRKFLEVSERGIIRK